MVYNALIAALLFFVYSSNAMSPETTEKKVQFQQSVQGDYPIGWALNTINASSYETQATNNDGKKITIDVVGTTRDGILIAEEVQTNSFIQPQLFLLVSFDEKPYAIPMITINDPAQANETNIDQANLIPFQETTAPQSTIAKNTSIPLFYRLGAVPVIGLAIYGSYKAIHKIITHYNKKSQTTPTFDTN